MKFYNIRRLLLLVSGILFSLSVLHAQVKEPFEPIHNGSFSAERVMQSPDPLITYRWQNPSLADSLQIYTLQPVLIKAPDSFVVPPVNRISANGITVTGKGDIFLDFGVESAGWLEFDSDDLQDTVEMSISEYNEPAVVNEGAQNPVKTKAPVTYGQTYRLELNDQLYEGVRFGWIHIRKFTKPWHIKDIRLICQVHPTNYQGSFSCNDTLLTRIWYTGAYTVRLNLMKDYFGAILMERSDRQSWTGDAYPAQAAALVAFGNYDMVKANLFFTSSQQNNGIPSYSLYWVLSLIDYVYYSGDTAFFNQLAANADHRLTEAYGQYDSLSRMGYMGWDERLGAGFENPQTAEALNTYKMLCIKTWARFAGALRILGNKTTRHLADRYERYVAEKAGQVKPADLLHFNIHALSEAVDGNEIKMTDLSPAAASLFRDRNNRLSYSPFNQYFIIQAMARAGYYPEALQTIRDCWGGQIHYGGTSFFEVYRPSWNQILQTNDAPPNNQCGYTSLCHPWGAGVTQWLSTEILGIKPAEAGFRTFTILPHLAAGITRVKGEMPTPHGIIQASFDAVRGECHFSIPEGTVASVIGIPGAGRRLISLWLDGQLLYRRAGAGKNKAIREDDEFFYLTNIGPG
ncbi:MAG: alpha-L-rhamnosidase C-terminal domain-containing protein, partial [Bacteroidota bacterium]|nr:alpha-L-rhamnosidase C-terminal domain-containing protein [Bacteroidota bacterium]